MEIADVCATTGRVARICDDGDEIAALHGVIAKQARAAEAMAAEVMRDGWHRPPQPVRVEPCGPTSSASPA